MANLETGMFAATPALFNTAITIPYCSAVLNGINGWFAAKPAVITTLDGGSFFV